MTKGVVTATINSNEKIQQVEGWTLSEDKKSLKKIYAENTTETVKVYDLVGNEVVANISINNIDKTVPQAKISYSTTKATNKNVKVTITADEKIKDVEGWKLSEDKKTLTKEFEKNSEENVTIYDLAGNSRNLTVSVRNIDKVHPKVEISYSTTNLTNKNVQVTIISNEEMQPLEGWTITTDGKKLIKEYKSNVEKEKVSISDLAGNIEEKEITIKNIDKQAPQIEITYNAKNKTSQKTIVQIKSNKKIQKIQGWNLDDKTNTLTKEFSDNIDEEITVFDLAGNGTTQRLLINNAEEDNTILPKELQAEDNTISQKELPNAGINKLIITILIILLLFISVISIIKIIKYKDIK